MARSTPTETRQATRADVDAHRIALRRIEVREHRHGERICNDEAYCSYLDRQATRRGIDVDKLETERDQATADAIARILGYRPAGLLINNDPRGYALKVQPEHAGDLHKDWGLYGILAPDPSDR